MKLFADRLLFIKQLLCRVRGTRSNYFTVDTKITKKYFNELFELFKKKKKIRGSVHNFYRFAFIRTTCTHNICQN